MTDELSRKPGDPAAGITQFISSISASTYCVRCRHTLQEGDEVTIILVDQEYADSSLFLALAHTQPCPITRPQYIRSCDIEEHNHDPTHALAAGGHLLE